MKSIIRRLIPAKYHNVVSRYADEYIFGFGDMSYSQEGEDMILKRIFEEQNVGFYLDVGAHHPKRFSNTYYFYNKGWKGINIDPLPGAIEKFKRQRPRDINLAMGVGNSRRNATYYMFNEPALNSFDERRVNEICNKRNEYFLIDSKIIEIDRLEDILNNFLPSLQKIDFMNIDVEGLDVEVIESNNWNKYRPRIVMIESLKTMDLKVLLETSEVCNRMYKNNYKLFAKSMNTLFFICGEQE